MELDHNVGRIQAALTAARIEENTMVVFVSDNGPTTTSTIPEEMYYASAGPWRGELGDPWEGSIRTVGMIRWPGTIAPHVSEEMISIMDFLPTFASLLGVELPDERPIDGIDHYPISSASRTHSNRDHLLTFIGGALAAVRWNQWRIYTSQLPPLHHQPQPRRIPRPLQPNRRLPHGFNIEADPREMRNVMAENGWVLEPYYEQSAPTAPRSKTTPTHPPPTSPTSKHAQPSRRVLDANQLKRGAS